MLPHKLEKELKHLISDRNNFLDVVMEDLKEPGTITELESLKLVVLKYKLASNPFYDESTTPGLIEQLKKLDELNERYGAKTLTNPNELMAGIANEYNNYIQAKLAPLHRRFDDVIKLIEASKGRHRGGRPSKQERSFEDFLYCSKKDKDTIISVLKESFRISGPTGIISVIKALEEKPYFTLGVKAELWKSIRDILDEKICADSNFNSAYIKLSGALEPTSKGKEVRSSIDAIKSRLP